MSKYVTIAVRYLNEVLEEGIELNPLVEQRKTQRKYRPIGLGIMGLADVFINAKVKYGEEKSIEICHMIGYFMAWYALKASCELAKEQGKFPACKVTYILKSEFIKENVTNNPFFDDDEKKALLSDIKKYGLRNSQLLTIAPTGTTSTIINVSGGIEPMFSTHYTRNTKSIHETDKSYEVYPRIVEEYFNEHPEINKDVNKLPDYFITARQITPKQRIDVQAAWQMHIDNSISSTVNLPESATVEDVKSLYIYAHDAGLKGVTVYRENCRREGILIDKNTDAKKETKESVEEKNKDIVSIKNVFQITKEGEKPSMQIDRWSDYEFLAHPLTGFYTIWKSFLIVFSNNEKVLSEPSIHSHVGNIIDSTEVTVHSSDKLSVSKIENKQDFCNDDVGSNISTHPITRKELGKRLDASVYYVRIGCGHLYITVSHDENGRPVEVFMNSSKSGGCSANAESLGRYASACLRSNMNIDDIVDITRGVKCPACTSLKGKGYEIDGLSCGDVMARIIKEEFDRLKEKKQTSKVQNYCPNQIPVGSDSYSVDVKKSNAITTTSHKIPESMKKSMKTWDYRDHSYDENIDNCICPECGAPLQKSEGCLKCLCGFSKC